MQDDEIEAVASAFYAVDYEPQSWGRAPEVLKEEFRMYARMAIAGCMDKYSFEDDFDLPGEISPAPQTRYLH